MPSFQQDILVPSEMALSFCSTLGRKCWLRVSLACKAGFRN
jgi:hypothetical protein